MASEAGHAKRVNKLTAMIPAGLVQQVLLSQEIGRGSPDAASIRLFAVCGLYGTVHRPECGNSSILNASSFIKTVREHALTCGYLRCTQSLRYAVYIAPTKRKLPLYSYPVKINKNKYL